MVGCSSTATGAGDYYYSVYRGDNPLLEIHDVDGLAGGTYTPHLEHRYMYGQAVDEILASENSAGTVLWGLADNEGTIRDIVNNSGAVVNHRKLDSFGNATEYNASHVPVTDGPLAGDFPFAFTGKSYDVSVGLYYYNARWYDSLTGRFVSADPAGLSADANLYRYVGNDPLNNTDPTGLCSISSPSLTTYYSRLLSSYVSSSENDPLLGPSNSSWTDQMREMLASSNSSRSIGPSFGGSRSPASNVGFSAVFDAPLFDDRAFSSSLDISNNYGLGDYNFNYRSAPSSAPMSAMPIGITRDGMGVILSDASGGRIERAVYPQDPSPSYAAEQSRYVDDAMLTTFIGDYSGAQPNALGVGGSVAFGLTGLDFYKDAADWVYGVQNWEWSWGHAGNQALNTIAFLPVVGAVKNLKHVNELAGAGKVVAKNLDEAATVGKAVQQEVKFAKSFDALKTKIGSAGEGNVWHHVVEQRRANVEQFGAEAIHNTTNVVSVPREVNQKIADYYSSIRPFTNQQTVRQWLGSQSWRQQYSFGQQMLQKARSGQPLP